MRKVPFLLMISFLVGLYLAVQPVAVFAQGSSASELIDAVNALRASQGLPLLRTNSILMGTAQAQSTYQSDNNSLTDTGPGGTLPRERALAAGYGGGATVFLSENVLGGNNLTATQTVQAWASDTLHWNTMMGANYQDVGAGVAAVGEYVYYTLDVGYVAGSAPLDPAPSQAATLDPSNPTPVPLPTMLLSTPNPDGSIVHIVQYGDTLLTIAKAYGVQVDDIRALNGMAAGSTNIYEGQKLIIRASNPPTETPTITDTPLPFTGTPTPTLSPRTPTPTRTPAPTLTPTPRPLIPGLASLPSGRRMAGIALIVICVAGLAFVGVSSLRSKGQ